MPEGQFQDFLNPRSMLTPGFAGGLTVLINNALGSALGVPFNYLGYTALVISGLFAALVLARGVPVMQRVIFFVLNTLIIFCVAMGSNTTVRELRTTEASFLSLTSPAYAQSIVGPGEVLRDLQGITANPNLSDSQKLDRIQRELNDARAQDIGRPAGGGFFKNWGF